MHTTSARMTRPLLLGAIVLLVAAACTSAVGAAGWTYAPPVATASAAASGSPGATGSPAASGSPVGSSSTSAPTINPSTSASAEPSASAGGNVIQLDETADLRITDPSGAPVTSITVQKGQTYTVQITNTAGFAHDFYIGSPDDLKAANTANLKGLDQFVSGTQSFTYTFDTSGPLGFGCTLPGHYQTMNGLFVIQ